ncbi:MAG: PD-(D/E)XK nuclease family protein [Ferruginibacter sp.]
MLFHIKALIPAVSLEMLTSNTILQNGVCKPELFACSLADNDMAALATKIKDLLREQFDPSNIAIIVGEDASKTRLQQLFVLHEIPFNISQQVYLFKQPFIKKIIKLADYISREKALPFSGDHLLFEILHFDFYKIPPIDIARLSVEVNSKKYSKTPTSIRKLLFEKAREPARDLFDMGINQNLKQLSALLEQIIENFSHNNIDLFFKEMLLQGLIEEYVINSNDRDWLTQQLNTFSNFIKTETSKINGLSLQHLIALIHQNEKTPSPLRSIQTLGNPNGIHLLTTNEAETAKYKQVFVVSEAYSANKQLMVGAHSIDAKTNISSQEVSKITILEEVIQRPQIAPLEDHFIKPVLSKFVMNVSALNSYLNCPLGFYYTNILRIPYAKNEALEFGSAVHHALELLFKRMTGGYPEQVESFSKKQYNFPPVAILAEDFNRYMFNHRDSFSGEAFNRRLLYGQEVLTKYYKSYVDRWNKIVTTELTLRGILVNGVPIKGKPDKLEFNGKEVNIVDYKTGNIERAMLKTQPPCDQNPMGGDYWRQAVFYTMLVNNYASRNWRVVSTEFDFIEPGKNGLYYKEKLIVQPTDITTVTHQLTWVWQQIQEQHFYTGCGKQYCQWCDFVKDNQLAVAFHLPIQNATD